jgi:hypothetical protein
VRLVLKNVRDELGHLPSDGRGIGDDVKFRIKGEDNFALDRELQSRHFVATIAYPFVMKAVSIGCVFLSAYLARAVFENALNERLFTRQTAPPSLYKYVAWFIGFHLLFFTLLSVATAVVLYYSRIVTFIDVRDLMSVVAHSVVDFVIVALITLVITMFLTNMLSSKKYFRYRDEGHRALRAISTIVPQLYVVVAIIPYYSIIANMGGTNVARPATNTTPPTGTT